MPEDKDPGPKKIVDDQVFRNFILLALPWLSLQRDMLAIGKQGIKDYSHVRPLQNFTLREIHALMMVLDPAQKWRDSESTFETRVEEASTQSIFKFMSGWSDLLESQEMLLNSAIETLNTLRNSKDKPSE